eukprot:TRINITY_DN8394_c0_g1_i1.p1 TRINITY_DN8394_c0_g1~~TRINITY_DN8394_c0_g1_i1.p1  ORF type:complete len:185 (-),score=15.53 TRINITY_DN8394_c0_g1_i1:46-570(-)
MKEVPTEYQFLMLTSTPDREAAFRKHKEVALSAGRLGSIYMFHGSPIGNWHSILRTGLRVQGQPGLGASGPSIWMANHFATSIGYCQKGGYQAGWSKSRFGQQVMCMGMLEVINDSGKGVVPGRHVNVVSDTSIIATRYFLIFKGNIPQIQLQANNNKNKRYLGLVNKKEKYRT